MDGWMDGRVETRDGRLDGWLVERAVWDGARHRGLSRAASASLAKLATGTSATADIPGVHMLTSTSPGSLPTSSTRRSARPSPRAAGTDKYIVCMRYIPCHPSVPASLRPHTILLCPPFASSPLSFSHFPISLCHPVSSPSSLGCRRPIRCPVNFGLFFFFLSFGLGAVVSVVLGSRHLFAYCSLFLFVVLLSAAAAVCRPCRPPASRPIRQCWRTRRCRQDE